MDISQMSDQEKSVMLARAMGWTEPQYNNKAQVWQLWNDANEEIFWSFKKFNLYDPANMALAWRVHLWALEVARPFSNNYYRWWQQMGAEPNAQRAWLDKILQLAIDAGLVEINQGD